METLIKHTLQSKTLLIPHNTPFVLFCTTTHNTQTSIISNDITIHKRTERVDEMARRARLEKSSQTGNLEKGLPVTW